MGFLVFITKKNNLFGLEYLNAAAFCSGVFKKCNYVQWKRASLFIVLDLFPFNFFESQSACEFLREPRLPSSLFSRAILFLQHKYHLCHEANTFSCFQCPLRFFCLLSFSPLTFACFCLVSVLRLTWWKPNMISTIRHPLKATVSEMPSLFTAVIPLYNKDY